MTATIQEQVMHIEDSTDLIILQRGGRNRLSGYPDASQAISDAVTGEQLLNCFQAVARIATVNDKLDAERYVVLTRRVLDGGQL